MPRVTNNQIFRLLPSRSVVQVGLGQAGYDVVTVDCETDLAEASAQLKAHRTPKP